MMNSILTFGSRLNTTEIGKGIFFLFLCLILAVGIVFDIRVALVPVGVIGLCAFVAFAFLHENFFYYSLLLSAPLNDLISIPVGPIRLRIYTICSLVALFNFLTIQGMGIAHPSRKILRAFFWFILIGIAFMASKVMTVVLMDFLPSPIAKGFALKHVLLALFLFLYAITLMGMLTNRIRLVQSLRYWIYLSNMIALYGLIQLVISNTTSWELVWHRDITPLGRPVSVFREPDVFGNFMGANLILLIPIAISRLRGIFSLPILYFSIGLHILLLLFSYVRAAWVAVALSCVFYMIALVITFQLKTLARVIVSFITIILLTTSFAVIAFPDHTEKLIERVSSLSDPTKESGSAYRINQLYAMVKHAWPVYGDRIDMSVMLFGNGEFTWSFWAPILIGAKDYDQELQNHVAEHGVLVHPGFFMPLTIWHDNGLVGVFFALLLFGSLFVIYFTALSRTHNQITQVLLNSTFLPFFVTTVCFCFSYDPISPFYWAYIALFLSCFYLFFLQLDKRSVMVFKEGDLVLWIHQPPKVFYGKREEKYRF